MKKILCTFVFAVLLLTSLGVWARPVSVDQARQVAESFLRGVGCRNASNLVNCSAELPFHQFYLFTAERGGFVLVAADDCVLPILGYSTTNVFDVKGMPAHVADWLEGYEEQIAYFVRQDASLRSSGLQCGDDSGNIVMRQWELLLAGQNLEQTSSNSVSPLLSTTWNQSPYYNDLCPVDYDNYTGHAYAGCTAIATAQVMKYWNHPSQGYGSMSYYHDTYGNLSANFGGTTYQWSGMPNALSSSSTSSQINAVATLVYHVGVAVNMNYGPDGSGAPTISSGDPVQPSAENALKNNFKYSSSLHSIRRSDYAPEVFASILCAELDNSRPIIFTGYDVDAGHAFVLDGYDIYGNFHVNWGWGSYCDGHYAMGALNPSTGGAGGNTSGTYNINNSAIIGVEPNYSFSTTGTTSVSVTANPSSYGSATGSGNYNFGDTVYLRANANAGCRFSQWSDGYRCNPRGFLAMGGNYSYTAHFEHLSGDTLGYVSANTMILILGSGSTGSTVYWGIRLPASVLTPGHDLKKVQMYVAYAGTYTANIYVGGVFSSPAASQTFTATTADEGTWKTVALTTPVTVTGNQDIYITFENYGVAYPAALTYDCGNDDGMLWGSSFSSIHDSWDYTFMIRGIFGSSIPTGDTLSYCEDNTYETNIGAGGSVYWGIKIPGSWQVGHTYLSSVQLYVVSPGTYDLILAQGGTNAPSTTIPIQSVSFGTNDVNQWHSIPIVTTYMLDSSQPLWVVFHNTDATYPAAACIANPDSNSSWCSTNGTTWGSLYTQSGGSLDYSWMIKCAVSNTLPAPNVSISGDTYFQTFTSKTFSAQSNHSDATYAWTLLGATPSYDTGATVTAFWSQPGTYNVVVAATSGGVTVRDTLQVEVYDCAPQSVPWAEYFNNATNNCWTYIGYQPSSSLAGAQYENWTIYNGGLVSYTSASSTGTVGRWVFLPAIQLSDERICQLKFFYSTYADQSSPYLGVYVASAPTPASALLLRSYNTSTSGSYQLDSISLADYVGQTVYLAFCDSSFYNYNCDNKIFLDGIQVEETSECLPFSMPFSCGFEATDDLSCWNFVDADGDGYGWTTTNTDEGVAFEGRNGGTAIGSNSYNITSYALTPDNWLISPAITLPSGSSPTLSWYDKSYSANYGNEFYSVYISTTGNNPADFTTMLYSGTSIGIWARQYVNLSSYAGQTVYIAFRHYNCTNQWALLLDDITIDNNVQQYYTVTANANNSSYGSVSGGGTYLEGSSVTLYATASADCRFAYWNDGNADNPRTFAVTGNVNYTAYFEHLSGDTLRYDNGIQLGSLGTEGSMSWAVRFNPTVMYGYSTLQKVQFPDVALGSYTISIHRGGSTAPGTLVTSQPVSLSGSDSMVTIDLNNPVSLNTSDPIWIVVDYSGTGYPAAYATSSGNTDGGWVSLDGSTWNDISEYGYANTWVLRGIMQAAPNTYTITAVANNPSYGTVTGGGVYPMGYQVSLSATPNAGYQFTNWNDGNTNATRTITVSGNATYTAYFQPIPRYDVTIACMGTGSGEVERADSPGSNICGTVDQVYEGFVASYKFLPSQGSELTHLYVNNVDRINEVQTSSSASSSSYSLWSYTPTGSTTIYSVFDLRNFTVDVATSNPAQGSVMGSGVYPYGSNVTLTAQPATGYHFAYWTITTPTGNTTSFQNPYVGTITGDMSATAYFDSDSYQITVTANDPTRGEVTGSGEYLYLEAVTATATPYSGYYFAGWSNGTNYNPYSFPATQDLVLQALFLPESDTTTYVVNAVANDPTMGSVTGAGTYAGGQQATITAQPSEGHHFVYWEISDGNLGDSYTSTQNPYIFTVEGFTEFRAIFAIDTFEITVSPNDPLRGTVSGSGQYTYMEAVTVIATPYSGYYFACWDNGSTQNPYMFQAIGNETLVALFLPEGDTTTYQITVSVNDSTMGEATGGGTYQQGETVTLSATAYEGYRFDNWSDGSTENPRTVVVTENKTYVAYFSSLTGIAEVRSVAVALYPNPTKGKIHVDADVVERIQIYDQVGRLIGVYEHTNEVDISGFASGIYTLRIQMSLGEDIKKVIKVDF